MLSNLWSRIVMGGFLLALSGCATVRWDAHVTGTPTPIFKGEVTRQKVLVLWGTAWRNNQKDAVGREEIASQSIEEFFKSTPNYKAVVQKTVGGKLALALSDAQIVQTDAP